jgi:3-oxoacyl-[acyl-carrier protein] reductase
MRRLENKNCIITGAGHGIGKATAGKFLREGARVLICDLVEERTESVVQELSTLGEIKGLSGDVCDSNFCRNLIDAAQQWFGEIHILVSNVGIASFEPFLEHSLESWNRTINVNLSSMFYLGQQVARVMVEQGKGGAIVNMASTNAHAGEAALAAYNASKGGVLQLTKTMAIELAPHNIRVNCVSPGHINTGLAEASGINKEALHDYLGQIPLRRAGTRDEVANLFAFLASDEASYITGTSVVIDGGQLAQQ